MTLDVEFYRRTIYILNPKTKELRRISVIDIHPEGATHTLVLVHGYGGNALQWLYQLRYFGQNMRVIAADLRGHGLSDDSEALPYSMNGMVNDLELVLDYCEVEKPFYLIAHSFGGAISTEYALRHPEHLLGLVLIGVPSRFIVRPLIRYLIQVPDPVFSRMAKIYGVALYAPQRTLKLMGEKIMATWRGEERFSQLNVPTLVVLGHRDNVFLRQHYEDVTRSIRNASQVVIPVSAHLVQLERPDAVNRAIRRLIDPKQQEAKVQTRAEAAQHLARLVERPWLQHYDSEIPEELPVSQQLLHDMLGNAAQHFPEKAALIFFGQKISYRELDLLTSRFANALLSLGVKKGDRVAVLLPNIPQCVIAFYGILRAGGVVVLGSPLSNEDEIHYQLRDSGTRILLTLASYRGMIGRICADTEVTEVIYTDVREYLPIQQRVLIASLIESSDKHSDIGRDLTEAQAVFRTSSFQHLVHSHPADLINSGATSRDLALLQYTSGTTDTPKGVMLSHSNLMINIIQQRHWLPEAKRGQEIWMGVLPLSHSYGVSGCMNLAVGMAGSLILLPTTRTDQILETVKREHPTIFPGVPALYLAIANYPKVRSYGISTIRICVSGSAPLPVEVQEAFEKLTRGHLIEAYGLTEAAPATHVNPIEGERRSGSIGVPLPSTEARIVHIETGEAVPAGEVGELLIKGPQVMMGYWKMPDETAQILTDDWLHTGDLARMDEDGFFTIVDRKKDLILTGSFNVYPRDVEEVLYEHPKVLEAAVVSAPAKNNGSGEDTSNSPFIKAVVVLKRGEQATPDELLALCRERLDAYKVPRQIEFRTELPKNFVGKVLRRLLIES